ncbi:hypothetical protein [Streptomyces sp. NPDC001970]
MSPHAAKFMACALTASGELRVIGYSPEATRTYRRPRPVRELPG